jgi:sugar/nucleoside kinase (ribokinase family)
MPRSRPQRLLSVGSILADIRITVPALPQRGGDVLGSAATVTAGGGFNILAAAARNGLDVAFAGQHGTGPYGERIRAELAAEGIALLLPRSETGDSGFCIVLVEPDGERTFITSPGVEARPTGGAPGNLLVRNGDAVFVSGYDLSYRELGPAIAAWLAAIPAEVLLMVDPGPLVVEIAPAILAVALARADILTLNRREAGLLAGTADPEAALAQILPRLGHRAILILRDGAAGCIIVDKAGSGSPVHVPAPRVEMVDSTGAGDAHTGVFLAALGAGYPVIEAAGRANVAAAIAVTRAGPATAPSNVELEAFFSRTRQSAASRA